MMNYLQKELYDLVKSNSDIFEFIQKSSLDGVWYWDLDNMEEEWMSPKFWITLGYDPEEMPHKASTWQNIIYPEDLELAKENIGKHLADPSFEYDQLVRYRHKNGSTVWIRCRGLAIRDEAGVPHRVLGAHVDVTQEKQMAELLTETNRMARVGAWEVNLESGICFWSNITKEIHEIEVDHTPNLEEGINFYKEGYSRDKITEVVNKSISEGLAFDEELQIVTAKNNTVWVRVIGHAVMVDETCVKLYGVFQDIQERKLNQEKLQRLSILESKSKEMEQFAYIASHDLREPLLTIKGYAEILEEDYGHELSEGAKEYVNVINSAVERMDVLIKGLLDYSRLSKVKKLQMIDINLILPDIIADLNFKIKESNAQIEYAKMPVLKAYPLEMKLIFQNLISNAIKFRKKGIAPKVVITHKQVLRGWEFCIADNGIGIAKKDKSKIFQLFQKLHSKTTYDGTGIGLANCKKIIELHNGKIWVESTLGEGCNFYFTILTEE